MTTLFSISHPRFRRERMALQYCNAMSARTGAGVHAGRELCNSQRMRSSWDARPSCRQGLRRIWPGAIVSIRPNFRTKTGARLILGVVVPGDLFRDLDCEFRLWHGSRMI